MIMQSSIATQRCWISDGKRGLGRKGMADLRVACNGGMSITQFVQTLNPQDSRNETNVLEAREWQFWDDEIEYDVANEHSRYVDSMSADFAAIEYHKGGFHVTSRP